ncbi:hypothetical protein KY500_06230 [Cryobacterium sp. PAMC25264]|nr:hypothetical protein [Cryobacterium sp. PAMC25264]QYF74758.1 hypothetical protein KY500_06230 [Cryobacterium sp. PAMC25264]
MPVVYDDGRTATYEVRWAPALIVAIDELRERFNLELVWLSTWNEADAVRRFLVPELRGFTDGRLLQFDPESVAPNVPSGWWKARHIIEEQSTDPLPFIWADDAEVELHGWRVLNATLPTKSLMVPPHPMVGLRMADVQAMTVWLEALAKSGNAGGGNTHDAASS